MAWGSWTSLEYDDEEMIDHAMPTLPDKPQYPYGTKLCLTGRELELLGLELPKVGEMLDMRAMLEVTCVSDDGTPGGQRVETQITMMKVENEDEEDKE